MAISYIMLRRAPTTAASLAVASRPLRAHVHGNGSKLCQQLYRTQRAPMCTLDHVKPNSPESVILDIIGSKLQSNPSPFNPADERFSKIPFSIKSNDNWDFPYLTLKRSYGKEEISVYISTNAIDAGKDIIPFEVTTTKETKQGGSFSLFFRIHAFPEKLEITECYTLFTNASDSQLQEKLPLSEFRRLNLSTSFIEYLSARGINPTTINALRAAGNDSLKWMKNLKKFIEIKEDIDARKDMIHTEVKVTKANPKQGGLSLCFIVYAYPKELDICSCETISTDASGRYSQSESLPLWDLDRSNLSRSNFIEYLDARGINPTTINILRTAGEGPKWMKSLKKFMEM
ncbi:Mitochondrial glycoprotein family protein [Corchorus capsularis]|uniref:Mitochondrial glycoprotein family protein n=1 Tax=Corchorus capsularis TaxID=210143 RepID=A0A1R3H7V4_COCAP|nr:Mitochondrial glycoprotein family protein [Corchorus capsularis]